MASSNSSTVFVSGLEEGVSEELLYAAFVPFGELKTVQVARDFVKSE